MQSSTDATINGTLTLELQRLLDKQAITECLYRYCRGVDRSDRALLATVYWPDADDDHMVFQGRGDALLDYLATAVSAMNTSHRVDNILIEFDGSMSARCESYCVAHHNVATPQGREDIIFGGRYLDRFEKRAGEWRIARRQLVMDYFQRQPAATDLGMFGTLSITGKDFPDDPLYHAFARGSSVATGGHSRKGG